MSLFQPYSTPEHQPFLWRVENSTRAALLIHGFPGTPAEMRPVAEILHADGWTTHGPLLPGFGVESEQIARYTQDDWRDSVRDALRALQADYATVLLAGVSMGGALSLQVAAEKPSPDGLILLAPFWRTHYRWLDAVYPVAKLFLRQIRPFKDAKLNDPQVRRELLRVMPDADLSDPQTEVMLRQITLQTRTLGEIRRAGQLGYRAAPHVTAPTLVIQGTRDDVVAPALGRKLAEHISGLRDFVEVDADHQLTIVREGGWPKIEEAVREFARSFR